MTTDIVVSFEAAGAGTRVRIEQTGFERLGAAAIPSSAGYEAGWNEVLGWFAEHAATEEDH